MSTWTNQFKEHQAHKTLSSLLSVLSRKDLSFDDKNLMDGINRISEAINYTKTLFELTNPELVQINILNSIDALLVAIQNELNQYIANKNAGHINSANSHVDGLISNIKSLPLFQPTLDENSLSNEAIHYKDTVDQLVTTYKKDFEEDKNNIKNELNKINQALSQTNNEIKNQEELIQQQKARLDGIISEFQLQFSNAEESRRQDHSQNISTQKQAASEISNEISDQRDKIIKEAKDKLETML